LADEVERLGVKVRLRTPVDPDLITDADPDEVVIATGSTPRSSGFQLSAPSVPIPGANLPHVSTSWEVLGFGGRAKVGATAVVVDDTGTFETVSVVDKLLAAGASVTVVSRHEQLGAAIAYPPATVEASRERLFDAGVEFVPAMAIRAITETSVTAYGLGLGRERTFDADTVCIVTYHTPNDELARYLADRHANASFQVHVVGNANGTDSIQAAIHSAASAARSL